MRLHVYEPGQSDPVTHDADPDLAVLEVVHVEEHDRLVLLDDAGQEQVIEVDLRETISRVVGDRATLSLVRNPLTEVTARISYTGTEIELHMHGATLVRRVLRLAVERLGIAPADAADLALRRAGSETDLQLNRPLVAYLPRGARSVALDLVHLRRVQG